MGWFSFPPMGWTVGVDALVRWCVGALVRWCIDGLVHWCIGVMVRCCIGVLVRWCVGVCVCVDVWARWCSLCVVAYLLVCLPVFGGAFLGLFTAKTKAPPFPLSENGCDIESRSCQSTLKFVGSSRRAHQPREGSLWLWLRFVRCFNTRNNLFGGPTLFSEPPTTGTDFASPASPSPHLSRYDHMHQRCSPSDCRVLE